MLMRLGTALIVAFSLSACAPANPPPGENDFSESFQDGPEGSGFFNGREIQLKQAFVLRTLKAGVLDRVDVLPEGTIVLIPEDGVTVNYPFRNDQGKEEFSSTGFLQVLRIHAVPLAEQTRFPAERLEQLHGLKGDLYVSALAGQDSDAEQAYLPALQAKAPGDDYLEGFGEDGKPKFNYSKGLTKRFGDRLNLEIPSSRISSGDRVKWQRIMSELERAGNRQVETPRHLLMIDTAEGKRRSVDFENLGRVSLEGAWTIAVEGTATRHGFANVPCAEFMSEMLRQAYARAGYSHTEDFNNAKKNRLDFKNGAAAVKNLSAYMNLAGWIPWEASKYIPPTGAIMMHETGLTPGHAYMSGGDRGRLIVDNGMPQGRDLRGTSKKILNIMYRHGVFFLPPGHVPQSW